MIFVDGNNKLLSRKEVIEIGYEHLLDVKDATKIEWADTLPRFVQITDLPLNETEVSAQYNKSVISFEVFAAESASVKT